jgi:hypothetical protein
MGNRWSGGRVNRGAALIGFAAVLVLSVGCSSGVSSPAAPSVGKPLPGVAAEGGSPGSPFGTNAVELTEMIGSTPAGGSGKVNVVPTRVPGFNNFEIRRAASLARDHEPVLRPRGGLGLHVSGRQLRTDVRAAERLRAVHRSVERERLSRPRGEAPDLTG